MWRKKLGILILSLFTYGSLFAQSSAAGNPPKTYYELTPGDPGNLTLPYDSSFTLKIHLKQRERLRDGVYLFIGKGNKKPGEYITAKNAKTMKVTWDSTSTTFNLRFD